MNEDKWQRTIANRRRARRRELLISRLFLLAIVFIAICAGGYYYYYQHTHSPEYTLQELQTAFAQRDVETIHKYVDFNTLLPPNYQIITDDFFANDKIYGENEHALYKEFYAMIGPILVEGTIQNIDKYIKTGTWKRFNYDSMLKGRQLGVDYTELINRSLLFNTAFKEVKSLTKDDDTHASATIAVMDKYTQTDFDLNIKLTKNSDNIWQVTSIDNYQDYLAQISNLYRTDITAYLSSTKDDLDKSNERFKQLQSEFTFLAEGLKTNPSSSQRALVKAFIENKIIPAYQDWYNYLQNNQIPKGARHLHELRLESASASIKAWKKYASGIYDDKPADLAEAERLHNQAMETEQKVTDTINNMPALFMPTID